MGWLLLGVVAALAEPGDKAQSAEIRRLSGEILRHAQEGRPAGVEREYQRALALTANLAAELHVAAASAALERGDTLLALARFQRAPASDLVANESYALLTQRFSLVWLSAKPGAKLNGPSLFVPAEAKAMTLAAERLAATGTYYGLLPAGNYQLPGGCQPNVTAPCSLDLEPGKVYNLVVP
jgi:hypothetical protein